MVENQTGLKPDLSGGHPPDFQAIEALARVPEAETFRDDLLGTQSVQCVADCPRWEVRPVDDLLLCQQAAGLEHFIHELRRRRQVLEFRGYVQMRYTY